MYAVADTHAVIWYLLADARLSANAHQALFNASETANPIGVPSICLVEIVYLTEKERIPKTALERLEQEIETSGSILTIIPTDGNIALSLKQVDRSKVPELPDRIIAATAQYLDLPLITRDQKIQSAGLKTIW